MARSERFDTACETGRARERLRRAALTTLASAAAKLIALAANLVSVPLALNYLGAERFSLWLTIASGYALLEFADLGLGNGLLNVIASATAAARSRLRTYVSSATFLLLAIAAFAAAAFFVASPILPWGRLFDAQSAALSAETRSACGALVASIAIGLPLGIVRRVQMGFQEGFAANLWQCAGSILSLAGLLIAIRLRAGLPMLVLCLAGAPSLALALNWLVEFRYRRAWLAPSLRLFEWNAGAALMRDGVLFVILQVGALAMSAPDPLIAASCLGLANTADFAVVHRLFMLVVPLQGMWLMALWPAYGEALASGDLAWVRRTLSRTVALAFGSSVLIGLVLVTFRTPIFSAWLHRAWTPPFQLCVALAACIVVLSTGMAVSMYLNGSNAIREQAVVTLVMTLVVVALKIFFCKRLGAAGIPLGMFIGYTSVMAPFFTMLIRRRLRAPGIASAVPEAG